MVPNAFRLGYLIHDVSRMRRTTYDQHMKPEGITRSQWWVLANLSRHPGRGMMSTELSKLLDVGKVTLGGLIDRLDAAGYVCRRPDKNDRRAKQIFITDAGYALIERMRVITERLNQQICEGMTSEEIEAVERHLLHIKDNLREMLSEEQSSENASYGAEDDVA
ncbi:hypothetical protein A0J57_04150 [Sphingobium sp. 22B]|nr:hypothetical protein AXW74_00700 [Sphingobium sp. AM]KYC33847.1 hypothetical protein A0J57_04150 [Sphingobium sp. 22B]OAP33589.1 hypothetical protein A8O16_03370 [Sphingobium sp. 20006FA]